MLSDELVVDTSQNEAVELVGGEQNRFPGELNALEMEAKNLNVAILKKENGRKESSEAVFYGFERGMIRREPQKCFAIE